MSDRDHDRSSSDRVELGWIARVVYESSIVDLAGIVLGQKGTRKNRIESEVHPTWTRHTSECIS